MNLGLLIAIIFLVIDILISIWNSYNSGKIYGYKRGIGRVFYALGGFLPMGYVFVIVLTFVFAYLGFLSFSTAIFLLAGSYLFFGLAIIMWGVIATYFSLIATIRGRSWTAGLVTVYDAFATILDAWGYITSFFSNLRIARRAVDSADFSIIDVILVIGVALAVGFVITYAAFREGVKSVRSRAWYY